MTRFRWGAATDVGRVRNANQDSYFAAEGFYVVADGMGGHRGGEVASSAAVESLTASLPLLSSEEILAAIQESNREVYWRSVDDPALRGMGTTMCVLAAVIDGDDPVLVLANVGDSRIYRFAAGALEQMTDDHSMVAELVRQGRIGADEAATHPQRNILTRALGIDPEVHVDAWQTVPEVGTRWLLCSDGLFNEVPEPELAAVLASIDDPGAAAAELVRRANDGGGRDNITVVVVDVHADDDQHAAPVSTAPDVVVTGDPTLESVPVVDAPAAPVGAAPSPAASVRTKARRVRVLAALVALVLLGAVGALVLVDGGDDDEPAPVTTSVATTTTAEATTSTATSSTTSTSNTSTSAAPTTTGA